MILSTKPDFERARTAWNYFLNGEVYKRPLVLSSCHTGSGKRVNLRETMYYYPATGNFQAQLDLIDQYLEETVFLGEAIPAFKINHGPDQFAAFLGAKLEFPNASIHTNWVKPIVKDWKNFLPIKLDRNNPTFQSVLEFARLMAEHGKGRYLVCPIDAHSHADTLMALRGPEQYCTDFLTCPDLIKRAMSDMRKLFPVIYDAVYEAGNMGGEKGCCQEIIWSEGKCSRIQCDSIIMLGHEHFREFVLPAIEEEVAFLDHSIFHLDGVGAFRHLDDLLAIEKLDMIQLVPGAGQPPCHEWIDLLKKCLAADKGVQVYGRELTFDRIKVLHRELGPKGVMYCPSTTDPDEARRIIDWLEQNT